MTPAEQGQERWTILRCECGATWKQNERQPDMTHTCRGKPLEVVPASELEMCQRYFDPMRRSRDEAEKRVKALERQGAKLLDLEHEGREREKALREVLRRTEKLAKFRQEALVEASDQLDAAGLQVAASQAHRAALRGVPTEADIAQADATLDQSGKGARS